MIVVGIFGPNDPPSGAADLAEDVGTAVVNKKWIVLTGGEGREDDDTIKERAIRGACKSGRSGKRWIGVPRQPASGDVRAERDRARLLLWNDFDHKRNYLEAWLCDVAVALPMTGRADGTISEAVSALCLRRPVVFVGDNWRAQPAIRLLSSEDRLAPLTHDEACSLIKAGMARFETVKQPTAVDDLLRRSLAPENISDARSRCTFLSNDSDAQNVLQAIAAVRAPGQAPHSFPPLAHVRYVELKKEYEAFVGPRSRIRKTPS